MYKKAIAVLLFVLSTTTVAAEVRLEITLEEIDRLKRRLHMVVPAGAYVDVGAEKALVGDQYVVIIYADIVDGLNRVSVETADDGTDMYQQMLRVVETLIKKCCEPPAP